MEIHPNIIHPSTPRPPQWSLPLRLPHQDPIHPPHLLISTMKSIPTVCILSSEHRLGSTEVEGYEEGSWQILRSPPSSDYVSRVHATEPPGTVRQNMPVNITGISNT